MADLREKLEEMAARAEAATPGPWTYRENAHGGCGVNRDEKRVYAVEILGDCRCRDLSPWREGLKRWSSRVVACIQDWANWTDHPANRDFICLARTEHPALVKFALAVIAAEAMDCDVEAALAQLHADLGAE